MSKDKKIYCALCGEPNLKHENTIYLRCHNCHHLLYTSTETKDEIVDCGSTQDGDWIKVSNSRTGEVSTYWKEG